MTYIETKKAEIAQKFRAIGEGSVRFMATREEVLDFFNGEIDTLLNDIESRVVKNIKENCEYVENSFEDRDGNYYLVGVGELKQAFQHLRTGVETE